MSGSSQNRAIMSATKNNAPPPPSLVSKAAGESTFTLTHGEPIRRLRICGTEEPWHSKGVIRTEIRKYVRERERKNKEMGSNAFGANVQNECVAENTATRCIRDDLHSVRSKGFE